MISLVHSDISCGVHQLVDINLPIRRGEPPDLKNIIRCVQTQYEPLDEDEEYDDDNNPPTFLIFSDNTQGIGVQLAEFIKKHRLGSVIQSKGWRYNPNSGNDIKVWLWAPNWKRVFSFKAKGE